MPHQLDMTYGMMALCTHIHRSVSVIFFLTVCVRVLMSSYVRHTFYRRAEGVSWPGEIMS